MTDPSPAADDLPALRRQIDSVDRELLGLLNRRAGLALAVGEIKKQEGSAVFRPEREAQVIDGLKAINTGPLPSDCVAPINAWAAAARAVNPGVIVLCHGGPIATPQDAQFILGQCPTCDGFYGASSMERLPTEVALTETTRRFVAMRR